MQLKALKLVLENNISKLVLQRREQERQGQKFALFTGLDDFRQAIYNLKKAGVFKGIIYALESTDIFKVGGQEIAIPLGQANQIEAHIANLRELSQVLNSTLSDVVGETLDNTINIKLPDLTTFDELSDISHDLQNVLGQVIINPTINGEVKILNVENGSIWIEVYLKTHIAVSLIASITRVASTVYQTILQNRILTGKARQVNIRSEINTEILQHELVMTKLLIDVESKAIQDAYFKNDDPELTTRIKNSITTLRQLMDKGAEIHPALNEPITS
jgi:hypothetical protein